MYIVSTYIRIYVYIYIHTHTHTLYIYIYICNYRSSSDDAEDSPSV